MLPVESDQYVSFEWIGQQNYLGERISRNGQRTRGANCTSADAIVMFERKDGKRQVVLIEWKYTESTSPILETLGESATSIWAKLVKPEGRFISVSTERLFGHISAERFPEIKSWAEYIQVRYAWVKA